MDDLIYKINLIQKNYDNIIEKIAEDENCSAPGRFKECGREVSDLNKITEFAKQYKILSKDIEEIELNIKNEKDISFINKLKDERLEKINQKIGVKRTIDEFLTPATSYDERNLIVEIDSYGNEESKLAVKELFHMYKRYFDKKDIKFEVIADNLSYKGLSNITFEIFSKNSFRILKHESGIHRIEGFNNHDAIIEITVMPTVEENEIEIDKKDLKIEVFRSKGHGGQSVNTTNSAVRITHIPTGIIVSCQDERSQYLNKEKALKILMAKIFSKRLKEEHDELNEEKRIQIGLDGGSKWIRTYDFKQNKLIDHRIGLTLNNLDSILKGNLDELFEILSIKEEEQKLNNLLNLI